MTAAKKNCAKAKSTNVPPASTSKSTRARSTNSAPRGESSEAPSSVPLQDHPPQSKTKGASGKGKGRASSNVPSRSGYHNFTALDEETDSPLTEDENEQERKSVPESQDPLDLLSTKQEDETTEPASDVQMSEPETKKPSSSAPRKRKRQASASSNATKPTVSRASTRVKEPSATPSGRSNKRLKGNNSTIRSIGPSSGEATRVFALWKQDGHYYSGTVH